MTAVIVKIGAIDMNNDTPDGNGSLWYVTESIAGWDSPTQRLSSIARPTKHGERTVENLYGARMLTVSGLCKALTGDLMYTSMYYLMSVTNALVNTTTLKVTEDIERYCDVLRSGEVRTAYVGKGAFAFEVNLRADDPFKYAVAGNTNGLVGGVGETLANAGTVPTFPVITLTATGTPTITVGSYTWTATSSIPSGSVIDMKAMTVLNGSTSYFDAVSPSTDWLWLDPGNNTVQSSVACNVAWKDAWV